jgi:hypothetical protein
VLGWLGLEMGRLGRHMFYTLCVFLDQAEGKASRAGQRRRVVLGKVGGIVNRCNGIGSVWTVQVVSPSSSRYVSVLCFSYTGTGGKRNV